MPVRRVFCDAWRSVRAFSVYTGDLKRLHEEKERIMAPCGPFFIVKANMLFSMKRKEKN